MSEQAIAAFAEYADDYHALRRRLVPCFDALYDVAADIVGLRGDPVVSVLDLGAGTGLLSEHIASRYQCIRIVLVDGAEEMLNQARRRLSSLPIEIHLQDLRNPLPDGPFDAVVSALAIHHLPDDAKQKLFARVHMCLRPGGVFVNAEQVAAPTDWLGTVYDAVWRRRCEEAGASREEMARADARMALDRCTDTQTHLEWMHDVGFVDVDCFYKDWRFAVVAGWRANA